VTLGLPCAPVEGGGGGAGPFFLVFDIEGLALGVSDGFEFRLDEECELLIFEE
jgi:hypothetical protein